MIDRNSNDMPFDELGETSLRFGAFAKGVMSLAFDCHDKHNLDCDVLQRFQRQFGCLGVSIWSFDRNAQQWFLHGETSSWKTLTRNCFEFFGSDEDPKALFEAQFGFRRNAHSALRGEVDAASDPPDPNGLRSSHSGVCVVPIEESSSGGSYLASIWEMRPQSSSRESNLLRELAGVLATARRIVEQNVESVLALKIQSAIFHSSPTPVVLLSVNREILVWNYSAEKVFGWRKSQIQGQRLEVLGSDELRISFEHCLANRLPVTKRISGVSDSEKRWVAEITFSPILSPDDEVIHVTLIASELSSEIEVRELMQCESLVTSLLAQSDSLDAAWPQLLSLLCTTLRLECGTVWGVSQTEHRLERNYEWIHNQKPQPRSTESYDIEACTRATRSAFQSGEISWATDSLSTIVEDGHGFPKVVLRKLDEVAVPIQHRGKLQSILSFRGNFLFHRKDDVNGLLRNLIALIQLTLTRDLSALHVQENEESLRQARKMEALGMMAGEVAHDFNNLLTVIMGNCELVLNQPDQSSQSLEMIREVSEAGGRAAELTRRILSFSRKCIRSPQLLNANDHISRQLPMLQMIAGKAITIETQLGEHVHPILLDTVEFEQIFINLTANARDAFSSSGKIVISTSNARLSADDVRRHPGVYPGEYLLIQFQDNGCGMDPETLKRVFEPFFTTKDSDNGTGLGLTTIQGIVKRARGLVQLESEAGIGTRFSIYLPRQTVGIAPSTPQEESTPKLHRSESIVLMEDDDILRRLICRILEVHGFDVKAFPDGASGVNYLQETSADISLVLSDIMMPGLSGFDVARQVGYLHPQLPVILMTGFHDLCDSDAIGDSGIPILRKPFTSSALLRQVCSVLDGDHQPANSSGVPSSITG